MDRTIVWAGQIPLETDLLRSERQTYKALSWLAQGMLGTSTLVTDVTVVPSTPAAMSVVVNPGQIFFLDAVDSGVYSSLAADTHTIVKQGLLEDAQTLAIAAPGSQSQVYLIQAGFSTVDADATVLPFYNPSQPSVPWSGPAGSGAASFRTRANRLVVSAKPGVVAASPVAPAPDAGYVGLYTVTVSAGATTITGGNIARLDAAPMLASNGTLPLIPTGVQDGTWITAQDTGSANAIVIKVLPPPTAYRFGQAYRVRVAATNTGATTINVNGLGSKAVVTANGQALSAGNLLTGQMVFLAYDGTNFQVVDGLQSASSSPRAYAVIAHTEALNTHGGSPPSTNAWFTRKMNTVLVDTQSIVTLSSNQFTLPAGTWIIDVRAYAYGVARTKSRLYDVTNNTIVQYSDSGNPSSSATGVTVRDCGDLRVHRTLASPTTFRVEQIVNESTGTFNLGRSDGWSTAGAGIGANMEIYAQVFIQEYR